MGKQQALRKTGRVAALMMAVALTACGGGGGGSEVAAATPPPEPTTPLTAYLASGEGGFSTVTFNVGANGVFKADTTSVTIQNTGASGCSITSQPADPDPTVCNRFADGKAYLFCSNTTSRFFDFVMLRQADFQVAPMTELAGTTMTGLSCGPTGPRTTGDTVVFTADLSTATEHWAGGSTWTHGPATGLEQPDGFQTTGFQHQRWAIYKVAAGGGTQYFLLDLYQADNTTTPDRPVAMYFLQK